MATWVLELILGILSGSKGLEWLPGLRVAPRVDSGSQGLEWLPGFEVAPRVWSGSQGLKWLPVYTQVVHPSYYMCEGRFFAFLNLWL